MGLDMYLYKINKKANNEKELTEILENFKEAPDKSVLKAYELFKQDQPIKAIGALKPWNDIQLDEFKYNEETNEIQYNGRGITITDYFTRISEEINDIYNSDFFTKVKKYLDDENKDDIYVSKEDVHYWRKHPDLHGYMEGLYYEKGGDAKVFNCVNLILSKEDIEELLKNIKKQVAGFDIFPTVEGFFFGATTNEDWENDIEVFEKLLKETDWDKETVYYSSWW